MSHVTQLYQSMVSTVKINEYSCFSFNHWTNHLFAQWWQSRIRQQFHCLFKSALSLWDLAAWSLFSQSVFYLKQIATRAEYRNIKSICCILQWHFISLTQLNIPYFLDCKSEIYKPLIPLPSLYFCSVSLSHTYILYKHTLIYTPFLISILFFPRYLFRRAIHIL